MKMKEIDHKTKYRKNLNIVRNSAQRIFLSREASSESADFDKGMVYRKNFLRDSVYCQ